MSTMNNSLWHTPSTSPSREEQPPPKRAKLDPELENIASEDKTQVPSMTLSEDQQAAVDLIVSGENTFLTGSAGSGKTVVLKEAIGQLKYLDKRVQVTAPTGRAAEHVGGITLAHFAGWTPFSSRQSREEIMDGARREHISKRFLDLDVLIIDEVSMVSNFTMERLNFALQAGRAENDEGYNAERDSVIEDDDGEKPSRPVATLHKEPFGGVQLICCGDFCQLPPVGPFDYCKDCGQSMKRKKNKKLWYAHCKPCDKDVKESARWAFNATAWKAAKFSTVFLGGNQRQSDTFFVSTLDTIARGGKLTRPQTLHLLRKDRGQNTEGAIKLFAKNEQVDEENKKAFDAHEGELKSYVCQNYFWRNREHRWLADREIPPGQTISPKMKTERHSYAEELEIKLGMPVILLRNIAVNRGLVNGSQGTVIGFESMQNRDVYKLSAIIYDKESCTLVPGRGGEFGALYQDQVKEFIATNADPDDPGIPIKWPRVRFENQERCVDVVVLPDCRLQVYGNEEPYSKETRTQIPLTAGWAMTVHKCQGMTLDKVVLHLAYVFQLEQVYVGLSRAKSLRGLEVVGTHKDFDKHKSDPEVHKFLKETKWDIGGYTK